ncbi:MAG: prepilin-type N-terminal cleavage/methylation domain-containing protein [Micavibrio aeruginosavorus]|nr:prepilin-type N-terminal cleavage/methylation domain-containing protein [Micavibrio aeruginosavorus]
MVAQRRPDCAKGFTLVEMAAVILIAGLIIFAVMGVFRPMIANFQFVETTKKMEKVSRILNAYAVLNYRLPCPAAPDSGSVNPPYGFESGSGADGATVPDACPRTEGIIPFRTLGIPEGLAIDGYDNYFTYAISPAFSQNTLNNLPATVHPACRTGDWLYDEGKDASGLRVAQGINPRKARFCCPGTPAAATDLNILDEDGNFVLAMARDPGPDGNAAPDVLMRPVLGGVALAPGHASYCLYHHQPRPERPWGLYSRRECAQCRTDGGAGIEQCRWRQYLSGYQDPQHQCCDAL